MVVDGFAGGQAASSKLGRSGWLNLIDRFPVHLPHIQFSNRAMREQNLALAP